MGITRIIFIISALAIGYWLASVFLSRMRARPGDDAEAAADRDHRAWHQVLEVDRDASREQVVAAYKRRIAQYHPDKVATMAAEIRALAERRSASINAAYEEAMRRFRT